MYTLPCFFAYFAFRIPLSSMLFGQLGFQFCLTILVAGLAEEGKHIFLIRLHTGLVEGIHVQQIAGQAAGILKEVDEPAQLTGALTAHIHNDVGYAALTVGQERSLRGPVPDVVHRRTRKEVQPVAVRLVPRNGQLHPAARSSRRGSGGPPEYTAPWSAGLR